jgi:hypothetical protein
LLDRAKMFLLVTGMYSPDLDYIISCSWKSVECEFHPNSEVIWTQVQFSISSLDGLCV